MLYTSLIEFDARITDAPPALKVVGAVACFCTQMHSYSGHSLPSVFCKVSINKWQGTLVQGNHELLLTKWFFSSSFYDN